MKRLLLKALLCVLSLFWNGGGLLYAQDLPPPDESADSAPLISPEDFIANPEAPFDGTLEEAYEAEDKLFGSDQNNNENPGEPNYNLKFEFTSHLQFQNPGEPSPYIEIQYANTIDTPAILSNNVQSVETTINIDPQNWGSLAQNEFFDCHLNIPSQQYPATVKVKLNTKPPDEEGGEPTQEVILKISFPESLWEPWYALCGDTSGHTLNTQGAPEEYDMEILKMIDPPISSMVIPFKGDVENKIDLIAPQKIVEDAEINNTLFLSGEGTLTISPL